MRHRIFYVSLTLLAFFAGSASTKTLAAESSADSILSETWTGLYGGVHIGYIQGAGSFSVTPEGLWPTHPSAAFVTQSAKGVDHFSKAVDGIQIGYRHQLQNWVVGLGANWSSSRLRGRFTNPNIQNDSGDEVSSGGTVQIDWRLNIRGQIGYTYRDYFIYLAPGIALAQTHFSNGIGFQSPREIMDSTNRMILNNARRSKLNLGSAIGAGVEYRLNRHWSVGLEYTYSTLGVITAKSIQPTYFGSGSDNYFMQHKERTTLSSTVLNLNYRLPVR